MLTVGDALKLDIFSGSRVVAGQRGLDRIVDWVHNVGVPDAAKWLNGGELVLTTAINMPELREEQEAYLIAMIEKDVAGLGIAVGSYIHAIPDHLCAIANNHNFPLIEVPYQVRFVNIAREINMRISQRMVKRALEIHQALTTLVLDGSIETLARTLADLVHQSVSIENERFEAYASVNITAVDEARRYTQQYGRTDPRLVRALETGGFLPQIRRTLRPVLLPKMPDVGLEMERILAPIVVHGDIYGYVWIIADGRPLSELEQMAIESGATIAALMLLREESVQREEAKQRGDLLEALMQDNIAARAEVLIDRALRYGVDVRQPFRVLLLEGSSQPLTRRYTQVNRLVERERWSMIVGQFVGQLVLLAQDTTTLKATAQKICEVLDDGTTVAISAAQRGINRVATGYQQSRETAYINTRLHPRQTVSLFDDLGYLHALYRAGVETLAGNPYVPSLRKLTEEQQADLFNTLETYLDAGGNGVATAELLHIHRSTLNYRLARITEICHVDLSDPGIRTNLQIALKLVRLFD